MIARYNAKELSVGWITEERQRSHGGEEHDYSGQNERGHDEGGQPSPAASG